MFVRSRLLTLLLGLCSALLGSSTDGGVTFSTNQGQWPAQVLYRAMVPGGALFVERDRLTVVLTSGGSGHHHGHADHREVNEPYRAHAYQVLFEGGNAATWRGERTLGHYENYFLGNDPAKWASGVAVHGQVLLKDLYPGIDLRIDGRHGVKYDLLVAPGADPANIRMRYIGQDGMEEKAGTIIVRTSAGTVTEEAPLAYGPGGEVACDFVLEGERLWFSLPDGYDRDEALVIDPVLSFASYSGSTADNFGFTATYDGAGHLYGGGIVFGVGYPATLGVLDPSFNGNTIDVGISKWLPDGTSLVWSTYLGGANGSESPHSLVVNDNDELFVLGATGSNDFAVTPGCYDASFNGGATIDDNNFGWNGVSGYGYSHMIGTDIFVAHFNAAATALIGSTYIGGSGNDGLNNVLILAHNYGDPFRGEIILDGSGNPVVATSTESSNAPVSAGAPQPGYGGVQDAYVFRMNPALTALPWATYYGGSQRDSGYGLQMDSSGEIFVTGGTMSVDLPLAGTPYQATPPGSADGYLARFNATGTALLGGTFIGTGSYDQSYKVQLNLADEVFVLGQTNGTFPVSPGKYANTGSAQFIQKYDHTLSALEWSTVIGNGSGTEDLSPSAFLVSDCGQIYLSGWAGLTGGSTTTGFPTTTGAFQTTTDGSDFYLMVLEPEAIGLNYATYFGGGLSAEHVDGGTSRFDKNGNVYQAVCAGCNGEDDFPTTPGAWSNTNNSFNCNLGVFKFSLAQAQAIIGINGPTYLCDPGTAQFINQSDGGNRFEWDFGDGTGSNDFEPTHTYPGPGTYTVTMILTDTTGCAPPDTATMIIEVVDPLDAAVDSVPNLCPGETVQLQASGGTSYLWFPGTDLSSTTLPDPIASPPSNITYSVAVTDQCGTDTVQVSIVFSIPTVVAGPDTAMCVGGSVPLSSSGGTAYLWSPANFVNDPTSATPVASPPDTTLFFVEVTTAAGCTGTDSVLVIVQFGPPDPVSSDTAVCEGGSVQVSVSGGDNYAWQAGPGISDPGIPDPVITPPGDTDYIVLVSNTCGSTPDTITVLVLTVEADAWPDTLVCPSDPVPLNASGGTIYSWTPPQGLNDPTSATPIASVTSPTFFQVIVSDAIGCSDTAAVFVSLYPAPTVLASADQEIEYGDFATLYAIGNGVFTWTPDLYVETLNGAWLIVQPEESTTYTVQLTDTNGCKVTDAVTVVLDGALYVPNTFTPNGDGINDGFFALGKEITDFRLSVFNRWGERIFEAAALEGFWDGTYNGTESPIDTYVWRVDYSERNGDDHVLFGHVNLVR
ncbi:MAG: gliding motility-associated C-terminal domain-containing protein [Flavobacteriales bacterium]|nr:gliding motility-associated C-terminal domain-containing protein [Flavobacteriales bacterium]